MAVANCDAQYKNVETNVFNIKRGWVSKLFCF